MRFVLYPILTLAGVVLTGTLWVHLLDAKAILESTGLSLKQWLALDILWAVTSGIVAWFLSRDISIWSTDTQIFEKGDTHPLIDKVEALARTFGWTITPTIGIYPSPEVNTFSAGPWLARSVISVSEGFLKLDEDSQEKLLYAELSKLDSGDTSLLVFCHGMTHGFVLYIARMLAFLLGTSFRQNEGNSSSTVPEIVVSSLATLFLTLFGSGVVSVLARSRHKRGEEAVRKKFGDNAVKALQSLLKGSKAKEEAYDLFTKALKARQA